MESLIAVAIMAISAAVVVLYIWIGYKISKALKPETGWVYLAGYVWGGFFHEIMKALNGLIK